MSPPCSQFRRLLRKLAVPEEETWVVEPSFSSGQRLSGAKEPTVRADAPLERLLTTDIRAGMHLHAHAPSQRPEYIYICVYIITKMK